MSRFADLFSQPNQKEEIQELHVELKDTEEQEKVVTINSPKLEVKKGATLKKLKK